MTVLIRVVATDCVNAYVTTAKIAMATKNPRRNNEKDILHPKQATEHETSGRTFDQSLATSDAKLQRTIATYKGSRPTSQLKPHIKQMLCCSATNQTTCIRKYAFFPNSV